MKCCAAFGLGIILLTQFIALAQSKGEDPKFDITHTQETPKHQKAKYITQYGITWIFENPVEYGQFINGDFWVVDQGGGVGIIGIKPGDKFRPSTNQHINGSMINPHTWIQGYDGCGYDGKGSQYSDSVNVGLGISPEHPLVLKPDQSLVSTISNIAPLGPYHVSYVKQAAVLTCLSSAAPTGSFRPGISSSKKTMHNVNSIDYSLLKSLSCPSGITKPDIETFARYFKMVWLDHGGWTTVFMRPSDGIPANYYYTKYFTQASLMLHLDYKNEEKRDLLINFIQLGIDLYSYLESGASGWSPDGGNMNGRKWPIMFAGIMLNYKPMKDIGFKSGDYLNSNGHGPGNPPDDYVHFGEDGQTFYVTQFDVDITNGTTWAPDTRTAPNYPYTSAMIGMPEWGIRHSTNPKLSDSSWRANYRSIMTGAYCWAGDSIAIRLMGAKELWNHNAYFDYIDRYMAIISGKPDPFGYRVEGEKPGKKPEGLIGAMFEKYRGLF